MMSTNLYWTKGPWRGKLALAARPRGGEWLGDDISDWKRADVNTVVSLLTRDEEENLDVVAEAAETKVRGMKFLSLPIPDRQVPQSRTALSKVLEEIHRELENGNNVVVHCRQGIGRTGLVAACLLLTKSGDVASALHLLSEARGIPVPETDEQRRWIEQYASTLRTLASD